jgi:hypothetical protein
MIVPERAVLGVAAEDKPARANNNTMSSCYDSVVACRKRQFLVPNTKKVIYFVRYY